MTGRAYRRILAGALCLLLLSAQAAAAEGLKRLTLRQDLLGWEAVGRLDIDGTGYCTGVLIAPDLALTAAHCMVDRDGRFRSDPRGLTFRAGLRDGEAVAESAIAQAAVDAGYRPAGDVDADNVRHDVALLQLETPIPAAVAAPFGVTAPRGGRVSVVSYAEGRDAALSREAECRLLIREAGVLAFDCDVAFGASGAPVFDMSGRRAHVVSLISAGQRDAGVAFGMELPATVAALKARLHAGEGLFRAPDTGPRRLRPGAAGRGQASGNGAKFLRP